MLAASSGLFAATLPTSQLAPPDRQPPDLKLPKPIGKVGFAIVGLGQLAIEQILPAFGNSKLAYPAALVSGHPDKANQLASVYGVEAKHVFNYEDFDKIANDPAIEAVYIVLPNHMHAEFTIRALKAGKHVLCEKPMAATPDEARQMCAAAKTAGKLLMIAYRLQYEPFHLKAIEILRGGALGKIKLIAAQNAQNVKPPNIRLSRETAGGPLGDVGVYCVNAARYLTGVEPAKVWAEAHQPVDDPRFAEVYESVTWMMKFPDGALATCSASFGTESSRFYRVTGTDGYLEMENAFGYEGQELFTKQKGQLTKYAIGPVDHFAAEMDHFAECVQQNKAPKTPGEEGLKDMIVMEAIFRSINERKPVDVQMDI